MNEKHEKFQLNIDLVNYYYLVQKPWEERTDIDMEAIKIYLEKYPELTKWRK